MKKSLRVLAIGILMSALLIITGCSSNKDGVKETSTKDNDKAIVVYSNSVSDGRGDFLKEKAEEKGFKLEIVDIGGNDLLNRIIAEKDAPIADVVFGMNQMMFSTIKDEGILEEYSPSWLDKVDENLIDKDKMFSPLSEQRVFLVYNSDLIKKEDAVKDWEELYNTEELKGKYIVPKSLGGATANAVIYSQLVNTLDEKGELGVSEEGWENIDKFFKNGIIPTEGQTEVAELASGTVDYAYTWLSNVPIVEESLNINLGVVNPSYGVPQTIEQVGIIKKEKMNSKVKEFIDWFGSAEVQGEWAEKFGSVPVNKDAQTSINSRVQEILDNTTPQDNDYDFINKHMTDWAEYIELNIIN